MPPLEGRLTSSTTCCPMVVSMWWAYELWPAVQQQVMERGWMRSGWEWLTCQSAYMIPSVLSPPDTNPAAYQACCWRCPARLAR